jgi:hypothetical protein
MTTRTGNFKQTPKRCNAPYSVSIIDHFALCLARFDEGPCLSCFRTSTISRETIHAVSTQSHLRCSALQRANAFQTNLQTTKVTMKQKTPVIKVLCSFKGTVVNAYCKSYSKARSSNVQPRKRFALLVSVQIECAFATFERYSYPTVEFIALN